MRYEEPYIKQNNRQTRNKRQKKRRRQSFGGWLISLLIKLLVLALSLALLGAGLLYALPVSLLAVEPEGVELSLTDGLPENRANVLLLGLDSARENSRRSDSIMIATIGYGELKLTSVLRDAVMDIPGHGADKLNAAYAYGGPELTMRTLNQNLKLNILHYVTVDYTALIRVVDALGGVEVNLTEAEMDAVNQFIEAHRQGLSAQGYAAPALTQCGENTHLDGVQALTYARVRKLDSDFMRAGRQRALLRALLKRLRASLWNPVRLVRLAKALFAGIHTDMSPVQLLSLGEKALAADAPEQLRLPVDGSYTDDGSALKITDMQQNVGAFQTFVYTDD